MTSYNNIDTDLFLYTKETFKDIIKSINKKLDINLIEQFNHYYKDTLYEHLSDKSRKDIKDLYIEDYRLIDKLF